MITNYEITLARLSDAETIASLSRDTIERGLSWSWTPQRVLRSLRDIATNTIVAREPGIVAGFAIMKYREEDAQLLLSAPSLVSPPAGRASCAARLAGVTARVCGNRVDPVEARETNIAHARIFMASTDHAGRTVAGLLRITATTAVVLKTTARLTAASAASKRFGSGRRETFGRLNFAAQS